MAGQESIGERVRDLRLSKHLSQAQLAGAELSDSYISLIESGKRSPTPNVIRMLATRLGCTAEYLSEGVEPEERVHLQVLARHAELALRTENAEQALTSYADVLARSDDTDLIGRARWGRAESLEDLGRVEDAIGVLEELREEAEHDRGRSVWLPVVISLARCYRTAGDLGRAVALGDSAKSRLVELNLLGGSDAADVGRTLILAYLDRGELDKAQELSDMLLAAIESDPTVAYRDASMRALEDGVGGEALYLADQALATRVGDGTATAQARLRVAAARALLAGSAAQETAAEALHLLGAAEPLLSGVDAAECQIEMARSQVLSGDPEVAVELTRKVLTDLAGRPDGGQEVVRARLMLGQALLASDEKAEALTVLHATRAELDRLPISRPAARLWRELGDLFGAAADNVAMMTAYRLALEAAGLRPAPQHQDVSINA